MAAAAPRIAGGIGLETPTSQYSAGIVDAFPRPNRLRVIESSVADRQTEYVLPTNINSNISVSDRYLEFRVHGVEGALVDLASLAIEMKIAFTNATGAALADTVNFALANGLSNTIFKNVQVYLGEKLIESNPHFNYWSYLKMITTLQTSIIKRIGKTALLSLLHEGSGIPDVVNATYFSGRNAGEKAHMTAIRQDGVRVLSPLMLDIASLDEYLLDNIDIRIKLELGPNAWFINSVATDGEGIKVNIREARLHVDRIIPRPSAIMALHQALAKPGTMLENVFNKTLFRTALLSANQTQLTIDAPFNNVIPEKLYVIIVDMQSCNGAYGRNPLYFGHNNLSRVNITINGSTIYDINSSFPSDFNKLYYETLKTLGITYDHLLHWEAFAKGCMLMAFNFTPENSQDTIEVEKSGILRVNLSFSEPIDKNRLVMLFAETQGVVSIDGQRNVYCDVRG